MPQGFSFFTAVKISTTSNKGVNVIFEKNGNARKVVMKSILLKKK